LAGAVHGATLPVIPERRPERFTGHLTLGRAKGRGRPDAAARRQLGDRAFSSRFAVSQVDLVSSESTPVGPRYTTVARAAIDVP
jgi:2'-5' RNA ligase